MNFKKVFGVLIAIVVVIAVGSFVIHKPDNAAHTTRGVVGAIADAGDAIGDFFHHLTQ